jgi:hypothetical protein
MAEFDAPPYNGVWRPRGGCRRVPRTFAGGWRRLTAS